MATVVGVGATGNPEIDGLLYGTRWSGTVTYSFPDSPGDYPAGYGGGEPNSGFSQIPVAEQTAITYAIALVASYTNLAIVFAGTNGADIRVAQSSSANPTSYAYLPGNSTRGEGGDIWFGNQYNYAAAALGNYYFATAIHELGHALGLKHSQETGGVANVAVPAAHDDLEFSVMSYRSYVGGSTSSGYTNEAYGYPQSYMANDILALQTLYGPNYNAHSENTVYSWSPTTGQEFINGVAQMAPGNGIGGSANRVFMTIWDGNGIDTYDMSNYTTAETIDLNPGASSITSTTQLAYLGDGHYAQGNAFNAYLFSNDPRSYIENAIAGSGNDTLIGNEIANTLDGGAGNDTIIGGAGTDTADYSAAPNAVFINLVTGSGADGYGGTDTFVSVENVTGSTSNDTIIGNAESNVLIGGGGNDYLIGFAGNDTLIDGSGLNTLQGGDGNDIYAVQSTADTVFEFANEGTDQVQTFLPSHILSANVENLTHIGSSAFTGIGNELNNVLMGGAGNDYLVGYAGNDTLIDGSGLNTLQGGMGNDIYAVQSNNDTVFEFANEGIDQVQTFLPSYTLSPNVENLTFVASIAHAGTGNSLANVFTGSSGNDIFTGSGGNDTFNFRAAGSGHDTITDFSPSNASPTELDHIDLSGRGLNFASLAFSASGNATIINIPGGDTIFLQNVASTAIHDYDFIF